MAKPDAPKVLKELMEYFDAEIISVFFIRKDGESTHFHNCHQDAIDLMIERLKKARLN
jgi:hypothetical protein